MLLWASVSDARSAKADGIESQLESPTRDQRTQEMRNAKCETGNRKRKVRSAGVRKEMKEMKVFATRCYHSELSACDFWPADQPTMNVSRAERAHKSQGVCLPYSHVSLLASPTHLLLSDAADRLRRSLLIVVDRC